MQDDEVARFEREGVVALRGAVPPEVVERCRQDLATALAAQGVDVEDPATWTSPVVRIPCPTSPAFFEAGSQPVLYEAYDRLLGEGAWVRLPGVGGTVPVRFPHPDDPGDAGWHVDGSFPGPDGTYWVNVGSAHRGLLVLFLFDDIGHDDAPTELKVGSHLAVPRLLEPYGDEGVSVFTLAPQFDDSVLGLPSAFATGSAGDVYVCHPFLVHRATWPHRGTRPRAIAQPGVITRGPFPLDGVDPSPVERAILTGLGRAV